MASVSSFNENLWRASISDRPRHKSAKQIYYPKDQFSKKKAKLSAELLELRHKEGEIDLWNQDVQFSNGKAIIRQLEGKPSLKLSHIFQEFKAYKEKQVTTGTLKAYQTIYNSAIKELGDFYLNKIPVKQLNEFINAGRYKYRQGKYTCMNQIFKLAHKRYDTPLPDIEIMSTRAERKELENKTFKTFLTQAELFEILEYMLNDDRHENQIDRVSIGYFFLLAFYFPRRMNDILHLKTNWIGSKIVSIGDDNYKTKAGIEEQMIPPLEGMQILKLLKKEKQKGERLFPYDYHVPGKVFKRQIDQVFPARYKQLSLHKLRDSGIIYLLYEKDWTAQDVMAITGHASFGSLEKYIHKSAKAIIHDRMTEYDVNIMLQRKKKWMKGHVL
ncbi:MAG: hypothetical protein CL666_04605 [Balneola sp.]|nr:hypothetical protein [Balneola sp.]|tara:strand:- start:35949 stop:37106 length:1158 start_codon:yes stop_codon:yes gene_type:complete